MKYFARRRHSLHTRSALDKNGLGNDPLTGVANLFDIGLVFIVGLIVTIFSAYNLQDLLSEKSEMTILKMSKNQEMEIITKKGNKIKAFCHLRDSIRIFDLAKIKNAKALGKMDNWQNTLI